MIPQGRCADVGTRSARKHARSPPLSTSTDWWNGTWPGVGRQRIPAGPPLPVDQANVMGSKLCRR